MDGIPEIVKAIEAYCAEHGIAESTFGRLAVNDGKLVGRLRDGKTITLDTLVKIERFMATAPSVRSDAGAVA